MKRILPILLGVLLMAFAFAGVAMAADTAKADVLRLEAVKGTVNLTNQSGKAISHKDGMKLRSGYTLATKAKSYAYVSLDDTKAVKLDAYTKATVKKNGKKLQLLVSTGKLFFNVKAPLKSDESLDIRTSDTVTGIRGTAGYVETLSANTSRLTLLDGHVQIQSTNQATGGTDTVDVYAGQRADFTQQPNGQTKISVSKADTASVPGFVAVEIAKDPELQEKIKEAPAFDISAIIKDADSNLKKAEATQEVLQQTEEKVLKDQNQDSTPLFKEDGTTNSGGNGGGTTTPIIPPKNLTGPQTGASIAEAFKTADIVTVNDTITGAVSVPVGKTLQMQSGAGMTADSANTLQISGTVRVESGASLTNAGANKVRINSGSSLLVAGKFTNEGGIYVNSNMIIESGGIVDNKASLIIQSGGVLENNGTVNSTAITGITNSSQLDNYGTINITTGTLDNSGIFNNSGYIQSNTTTYGIIKTNGEFISTGSISKFVTINRTSGLFMAKENNLTNGTGIGFKLACDSSTIYGSSYEDILTNAPDNSVLDLGGKTAHLSNTFVNNGDLTIKNGSIEGNISGYLIDNSGDLVLIDIQVINGSAGGGINNSGNLTLDDSLVQTDSTSNFAIDSSAGSLNLENGSIVNGKDAAYVCNPIPEGYEVTYLATEYYALTAKGTV